MTCRTVCQEEEMWNTFNNLAQKAKAVAANLEGQLDKSVGIDLGQQSTAETAPTVLVDDDDENAWNDDFQTFDNLSTSATSNSVPTAPPQNDDEQEATAFSHKERGAAAVGEASVAVDETAEDDLTEPESQSQQTSSVSTGEDGHVVSESSKLDMEEAQNDEQSQVLLEDLRVHDSRDETGSSDPFSASALMPPTSEPTAEAPDQAEQQNAMGEPTSKQLAPINEEYLSSVAEPAGSAFNEIPDSSGSGLRSSTTASLTFDETSTRQAANQTSSLPVPVAEFHPEADHETPADPLLGPKDQDGSHVSLNTSLVALDNGVVSEGAEAYRALKEQLAFLQNELQQREFQLISKTEQLTSMQSVFDNERQELEQRLENTKEEAKRRLAKARERVEAAEKRANTLSSASSEAAAQNEEIISALRAEGEKLARKQLEMEQAVRTAKGEARELREAYEAEAAAKDKALEKIAKLELEVKNTKAELSSARKGESQASKLETDLQLSREESERKSATILTLEQQIKELKASSKELVEQLAEARKGAVLDSEREVQRLKKEHISMLEDLEAKLRTTEKEAAVREDALRHEVAELRKRWQDAVRRADSLSMDVQSSTAPLLRQLESMERQNRTRAAAWATLENKLRQEMEDAVVSSEQLRKERNEHKAKAQLFERQFKETELELQTLQSSHEEKTKTLEQLQNNLSAMETLHATQKKEWDETLRLANEAVVRVRNEMKQTVVEAEERHVSQLDSLEKELRQEREKRKQLEEQVQGLLDKADRKSVV